MLKIIDASVAIKWFLREEVGSAAAMDLLDELKNSPSNFAVPELFFNEMLSVFCKLLTDESVILDYIGILQALGWERLGNGREVLKQATHLAKKYQLSGYDAIYAANAKLTHGLWITADEKAHKKIAGEGYSKLLLGR